MEAPALSRPRVSRVTKLTKPSPLKRSNCASDVDNSVQTSANDVLKSEQSAKIEMAEVGSRSLDKENVKEFVGRSSRRLKLLKPAPLKSSLSSDKLECSSNGEDRKLSHDQVSIPTTPNHDQVSIPTTPSQTDIVELEPRAVRLLSQVSQDSGIGDISYSRQNSLLDSVIEDSRHEDDLVNSYLEDSRHEDDLDWNDIDDNAEDFTFGAKRLEVTSYMVNQVQPFNSLEMGNVEQPRHTTPKRQVNKFQSSKSYNNSTRPDQHSRISEQNTCGYVTKQSTQKEELWDEETITNVKPVNKRSSDIYTAVKPVESASLSYTAITADKNEDKRLNGDVRSVKSATNMSEKEKLKARKERFSSYNSHRKLPNTVVSDSKLDVDGESMYGSEHKRVVMMKNVQSSSNQSMPNQATRKLSATSNEKWDEELIEVGNEIQSDVFSPVKDIKVNIKNISPAHEFKVAVHSNSRSVTPVNDPISESQEEMCNSKTTPKVYNVIDNFQESNCDTEMTPKARTSILRGTYANQYLANSKTCDKVPSCVSSIVWDRFEDPLTDICASSISRDTVEDHSNAITLDKNSNDSGHVNHNGNNIHIKSSGASTSGLINHLNTLHLNTLPVLMAYRDKTEVDMNSSYTKSSATDTDEVLSTSTSDEGFNEQDYAWEQIEDLTSRVGNMSIDKTNQIPSVSTVEDSSELIADVADTDMELYPHDIDDIEAELDFMKTELELDANSETSVKSESVKDNIIPFHQNVQKPVTKYVNSVVKRSKELSRFPYGFVVAYREPLSPTSLQEDIWEVEEREAGGLYTAKGRRSMFKSYKMCREEEKKEVRRELIQYSPEALLTIGLHIGSTQQPESWSYLQEIYTDVCPKQVSKFLDIARYMEERNYVVEQHVVLGDRKLQKNDKHENQQSRNGFGTFPGFQRSLSTPVDHSVSYSGKSAHQSSKFTSYYGDQLTADQFKAVFQQQRSLSIPENQPVSYTEKYANQSDENHSNSTTTKSGFRSQPIDLNTKCDVSVRNNIGGMTMFTTTTREITPASKSNGFVRSLSDPEGDSLKYNTFEGKDFVIRDKENKEFEGEGLYMNKDLPDKCPW